MKILYLNVAGAIIKISFHPAEGTFFYNKLILDITTNYTHFFIKRPTKIDYFLDFHEYHNREIFVKKKGGTHTFFVDFCKITGKNRITTYYKIGLVQFQFIISNIVQKYLAENKGFILHASGVVSHNETLLFTGKPGSGKSTVMNLLKDLYEPLADDSVIIKKTSTSFLSFQTPFIETNNWAKKRILPMQIKGIFFLRKSKTYSVREIKDTNYIMERLSKQLLIRETNLPMQIKYLLEFVKTNRFYFLYFGKNKKKLISVLENYPY